MGELCDTKPDGNLFSGSAMGLPTYSGMNCGDIGVEGSELVSTTDDRYKTERQSLPEEVSTGVKTTHCISASSLWVNGSTKDETRWARLYSRIWADEVRSRNNL